MTVAFDASQSRDNEEGRIVRNRWNFADGADAVGPEAFEQTATYTFRQPGRYNVALTVSNEKGIPSSTVIPVLVHPPAGGCVLSAWVKDSYYGPRKGYLRKQVLLDSQVIWEEDVEGDEGGWQHLVLDLNRYVKDKKSVELTFRLQADKAVTDPAAEFCECYYYVDDVHLFGGSVVVGDFEADGGWTYHEQDWPWSYRKGRWSGESRSGKYGCVIGFGYNQRVPAGGCCEIKQTVPLAEHRP